MTEIIKHKFQNNSSGREPAGTLTRRVKYGTRYSAGLYEEIIHGHPDALKGYLDIRVSFQNSNIRIVPCVNETAAEAIFRKRCQTALDNIWVNGDPTKDFRSALEQLSDAIVYGACIFEAVWKEEGVIHLHPIPLSWIDAWKDEGGVAVPYQGINPLPVERLIHVCPVRSAGPEGIGVLRPLAFPFQLWRRTLQDMGIRAGKEAGGIIMKQPLSVDNDAAYATTMEVDAFVAGEVAVVTVPADWELEVPELPQASSNLDIVEYCDQKIRSLMDDTLTSLISVEGGSRALGDSLSEEDAAKTDGKLESCIKAFGSEFFKQVARGFEYVGRFPSLTSLPESEVDPAKRVHVLTNAYQLTGWTSSDRDDLRKLLGLEEMEKAGTAIEVRDNMNPYGIAMADLPPEVEVLIDANLLIRGRNVDEAKLEADIADIADELRGKINGHLSHAEYDELKGEYVPRFQEVIEIYAVNRKDKAYRWADDIINKAISSGAVRESADTHNELEQRVQDVIDEIEEQVQQMTETSARVIFNRVTAEREFQAEDEAATHTRITDKGLAEDAAAVGHAAEQQGRLEGFMEEARNRGEVMVGAYRMSFEDRNVCNHCKARAGRFYTITEMRNNPLPDPDCEGGVKRCRCGWVPVLRKRYEQTN